MNSGGLKVSISSWMYNLSIYFNCILVLTNISCGNVGYKLYVGSLRGACRWTGSNGSDKRACRSSKVYGLSWKEIRVGGCLGVLGSCRYCRVFLGWCRWRLTVWFLVSNFWEFSDWFLLVKKFMFIVVFFKENN